MYFVNGAVSAQSPYPYHAGGLGSLGARFGNEFRTPPRAGWVVGVKVVVLTVVLKVWWAGSGKSCSDDAEALPLGSTHAGELIQRK